MIGGWKIVHGPEFMATVFDGLVLVLRSFCCYFGLFLFSCKLSSYFTQRFVCCTNRLRFTSFHLRLNVCDEYFTIQLVAHKFNRNKYSMHSAHVRYTPHVYAAAATANVSSERQTHTERERIKIYIGICMNYWQQLWRMKSSERR